MSTLTPDMISGPERGTKGRRYNPAEDGRGAKSYTNVGPAERVVMTALGTAAVAVGVGLVYKKQSLIGGLSLAAAGAVLAARSVSGHCPMYEAVGVNPNDGTFSNPFSRGIVFTQAVTINKPVEEVYRFYRDFTNLPRVMKGLRAVEKLDPEGGRTRWVADVPTDAGAQWTAVITRDQPNRLIEWESEAGSRVTTRGRVDFEPAPADRGTVVRVRFEYEPLGGAIAAALLKAFGQSPKGQVRMDLKRLKSYLEAGEVPTTEGQPQGTCGQWRAMGATRGNASADSCGCP